MAVMIAVLYAVAWLLGGGPAGYMDFLIPTLLRTFWVWSAWGEAQTLTGNFLGCSDGDVMGLKNTSWGFCYICFVPFSTLVCAWILANRVP